MKKITLSSKRTFFALIAVLCMLVCFASCFAENGSSALQSSNSGGSNSEETSEKKYALSIPFSRESSIDEINQALAVLKVTNIATDDYCPDKMFDDKTEELLYYYYKFDLFSDNEIASVYVIFATNKDYEPSFDYIYSANKIEKDGVVFEYSADFSEDDDGIILGTIYAKITTSFEEIYVQYENIAMLEDDSIKKEQLFFNFMSQMFSLK